MLKFVLEFTHLLLDFSESIFIFGMEFCFGIELFCYFFFYLQNF